jgi:hypothetical protein
MLLILIISELKEEISLTVLGVELDVLVGFNLEIDY